MARPGAVMNRTSAEEVSIQAMFPELKTGGLAAESAGAASGAVVAGAAAAGGAGSWAEAVDSTISGAARHMRKRQSAENLDIRRHPQARTSERNRSTVAHLRPVSAASERRAREQIA